MRVNVYNEDIFDDRVELAQEVANTVTFQGIRIFVGKEVEHTAGDDDTPAVTFWYSDNYVYEHLKNKFQKALEILENNPPE